MYARQQGQDLNELFFFVKNQQIGPIIFLELNPF
jgi:hypothetical protein